MEANELANVLSALGTDGIRAFIAYQIIDFVEVMTLFLLASWGIRTVWKQIKKREFGDE